MQTAWRINRDLLPAATFRPAVNDGYQALTKNIQPTGMLGFVQKIGDAPDKQDTGAESTEVYGEGYDVYKVGDTRGCGGISLWADGSLHNSDTFIANQLIENSPQRVSFEFRSEERRVGKECCR